jgi:AmiR/NasT family two-component response regulator
MGKLAFPPLSASRLAKECSVDTDKAVNGGRPRSKTNPGEAVPTSFGRSRVLIADDEHLVATGLAAAVRELGHEVVAVVGDGEAALEAARRHKPDLALLDIRMPRMTGIDAARAIYDELGIPTIIISAYSDAEHVAQIQRNGLSSGIFGYALKPVSAAELGVMIGTIRHRAAIDDYRRTRVSQLETNLLNRRTVEQAKWKMVEKLGLTEPQAHEKLQRMARDRRRPLIEIAKLVLESDTLPI